jgi:2-methylcitrate dehydratase PrpD
VQGLHRTYKLEIEFKPYSCARPIHNAIDCALAIRVQHRPDLNAIQRIVMARHPDWAHYHQNPTPRTYHEAQVSLPFSVAVALRDGAALLKQYTDANIANPLIKRLSNRVEFVVDKRLPRGVSCRMTMQMVDGRKLTSQVDYPKGSIQNAMSDAELRAKFEHLAAPVLGSQRAARLADAVRHLERCANVRSLMQLAVPAKR